MFRSCRSSLPPSALYVGNLPFDICGYAVENSLASLLRQQSIQGHGLQGCIQTDQFNIGRGSPIFCIRMWSSSDDGAFVQGRSLLGLPATKTRFVPIGHWHGRH